MPSELEKLIYGCIKSENYSYIKSEKTPIEEILLNVPFFYLKPKKQRTQRELDELELDTGELDIDELDLHEPSVYLD